MNHLNHIYYLFPKNITESVFADYMFDFELEEIRIKIGKQIIVRGQGKERVLSYIIKPEDISYIIGAATDCTYYSAGHTLKQGYIPLRYGCRMGVSGAGNGREGILSSVDDISSLCIRVAGERRGCASEVCDEIYAKGLVNTLIVSPPGYGKTSLLRDMIRTLSYRGSYVGVADERGEITGAYQGVASFDLGPRCDYMIGLSKQKAAIMLIRSMAPDIIAMDEITENDDLAVIHDAMSAGVALLSTVHGYDENVLNKKSFQEIKRSNVFQKAIIINRENGNRMYRVVDLND